MSSRPTPDLTFRILVVDDDESVRRVITRLLGPIASAIQQAGSAEQALELLRETPPDLVILDVHLPGKPGHAVLDAIRMSADLRLVPVVMVSGEATREERLKAIRAGVTDFFAKPFDAEEFIVRVRWLAQLKSFTDTLEEAHRVIVALARTVDARDAYTAGHSQRVSVYAGLLAAHIGLSLEDAAIVRQGSLFHDLGKIAVRDGVLLKPGRLTPEEFAEMKRHPVVGHDLLQPMRTLARALPIVQDHHEKLDGSGYPHGIAGDDIATMVRIVTLADVYDGLTSLRPYREPFSIEDALRQMQIEASNGCLDGELANEFHAALRALPRPCLAPTAH
jgi:putative two-component system response regulator